MSIETNQFLKLVTSVYSQGTVLATQLTQVQSEKAALEERIAVLMSEKKVLIEESRGHAALLKTLEADVVRLNRDNVNLKRENEAMDAKWKQMSALFNQNFSVPVAPVAEEVIPAEGNVDKRARPNSLSSADDISISAQQPEKRSREDGEKEILLAKIEEHKKQLTITPNDAQVQYELAHAYYTNNQLQLAIDHFKLCDKQNWMVWNYQANAYLQLGDFVNALSSIELAISRNDKKPQNFYLKALIVANRGDKEKAYQIANQAKALGLIENKFKELLKRIDQVSLPQHALK